MQPPCLEQKLAPEVSRQPGRPTHVETSSERCGSSFSRIRWTSLVPEQTIISQLGRMSSGDSVPQVAEDGLEPGSHVVPQPMQRHAFREFE